MRKMKHQFLNRFFRYKDAKDGATAIEFALLALPFFALLFAILELAIIFFISSTMTHAVSEAGRKIRTGNFQNCSQDQFKALVCAEMVGLGNCEERLRLDVVTNSNFSSVSLPPPPAPPPTPPPPAPQVAPPIPNGLYAQTGASAPVIVRALYYHKLVLPTALTRLENIDGTGVHRMRATTAFQNEPFPAGTPTTCT